MPDKWLLWKSFWYLWCCFSSNGESPFIHSSIILSTDWMITQEKPHRNKQGFHWMTWKLWSGAGGTLTWWKQSLCVLDLKGGVIKQNPEPPDQVHTSRLVGVKAPKLISIQQYQRITARWWSVMRCWMHHGRPADRLPADSWAFSELGD